MPDLLSYIVVLWMLDLAEGFRRLDVPSIAILRGKRPRRPYPYPGGNTFGWIYLSPIAPLEPSYFAHHCPIAVSTEGLGLMGEDFGGPVRGGFSLKWAEVARLSYEGEVLQVASRHNVRYTVPCRSVEQARRLAAALDAVRVSDGKATAADAFVAAQFDEAAARSRLEASRGRIGKLRWIGHGQMALLLVGIPLLIWAAGYGIALGAGAIAAYALSFYAASVAQRWTLRLYPYTAVRGADAITTELLSDFHPWIVLRLLAPEHAPALGEIELRRVLYPLSVNEGLQTQQAYLSRVAVKMKALGLQEKKQEGGGSTYCPRCLTKFMRPDGECSDCRGVALRAL